MFKKPSADWKQIASISFLFLLVTSVAVIANNLPKVRPTKPQAAELPISPSKDTWVTSNSCCLNSNFGGQNVIETGPHSTGYYSRAALEFSLSSIPAGSTINSAKVQLWQMAVGGGAADSDMSPARNVLGPWTETGLTWNNQPGYGDPYDNHALTTAIGWKTWDITSLVKDWFSGAKPNYGIYIYVAGSASADRWRDFYSKESGSSSLRPKLIVNYTSPPTPTCSNECSASGAKQCAGNTAYQTCGSNYDADSCLEWSPATSCLSGQTCSGGNCITSGSPKPKPPGPNPPGPGPSGVLNSLQLTLSVPYLIGEIKIPVKIGSLAKELEVLPDKKDYQLDVKEANISVGSSMTTVVVGGNKTLIKKIQVTPNSETTAVNVGDLLLGDITGDNKIDDKDSLALLDSITKQTLKGDLNADKITNSVDWAIFLANYGKSGDF